MGSSRLGAPSFDHANERTCQSYETSATEFSRHQQRLPLRLRPLATSVRQEQHHEVEVLAHVRRVSRRDNRFEDEKPRTRLRSRVNVPEELHAVVVFPVVQDVLEQVTIGAGWHCVEKIAADDIAAVRNAEMLKDGLGFGNDDRQIVEHAAL
jgi:hypothetical protein